MRKPLHMSVLSSVCLAWVGMGCIPAAQAETVFAGAQIEDTAQVAGQRLQLNGAGISRSWLVDVYVIALYAPERIASLQDAARGDGARRIRIALLRDINGSDFRHAIAEHMAAPDEGVDVASLQTPVQHLVQSIASRPQGLRQGDVLTMDWVPGTGTVITLNQKPLMAPVHGFAFYKALLSVWLGDRTSDRGLREQLLGRSQIRHMVSND